MPALRRFRSRLRPTPVMIVACSALFVALGGTALATTYVVSSNSEIGPNTISGHTPPSGDHANVIGGSLNATDLASSSVTNNKLAPNSVNSGKVVDGSLTGADLQSSGFTDAPGVDHAYVSRYCGQPEIDANEWQDRSNNVNERAQYWRDPLGVVHLRGSVLRCGNAGQTIFTLPAGFRPGHLEHFAAVMEGSTPDTGQVTVGSNGDVASTDVPQNAFGDRSIALDGITFRCEPSGQNGCR